MAVNLWHGIGNLGKEPDVRQMNDGKTVCNVSLAISEKYLDKSGEKKEITECSACRMPPFPMEMFWSMTAAHILPLRAARISSAGNGRRRNGLTSPTFNPASRSLSTASFAFVAKESIMMNTMSASSVR